MTYTKGPWEILRRDDGSCTITGPGTTYLATLATWKGWAKETNANAQLMMAAPELLETLTLLLSARDVRRRISLWPQRFKQIKIKGSASRRRFERHYAGAIARVIIAEKLAHDAVAKAQVYNG